MTVSPDHGSVWGCHLPPYPCSRLPFNSNHTQWPLEKTQCLLDLRRILTPHPRNHPIPVLRGDPIRTNFTGAAYLAGQFLCLIRRPRRALRRSSQAPASTRETAVRVAASESEIFTPVPASARGDASQRETGEMPSRLRCALYRHPLEARPRAVRGKRANPGAVPQISAT